MRAYDVTWMQVEEYLQRDDRVVLPIGATEQHAYLSLGTDNLLAERVANEAADPLGVFVLPALPFGVSPGFAAFPGTVSLTLDTLVGVLRETLDTLYGQGFRRFLIVNGHGGNVDAAPRLEAWANERANARVVFHSWWDAPLVREAAEAIDPDATHASWFENFPWTRVEGVELPHERKPAVTDPAALRELDPEAVRAAIGDGSYGGPYQVDDADALRVWQAGVTEVRELIASL